MSYALTRTVEEVEGSITETVSRCEAADFKC